VVAVAVEPATLRTVTAVATATALGTVTAVAVEPTTVIAVPVEATTLRAVATVAAAALGTVATTVTAATGGTVIATRTVIAVAVETATGRTVVTTRTVVTVVTTRTTVVGPAPARPGLVAAAVVRSTLGTVLGLVRHCGDSFCFSSTADWATPLPLTRFDAGLVAAHLLHCPASGDTPRLGGSPWCAGRANARKKQKGRGPSESLGPRP
ncbi:hypothetical protein ACGFZP_35945, partial [Kitasatospora sp. NPDC048239]|uniref:hypothetical protein n=1 Tax=Kitasatospora sp. NPDC048239 TaxID=3364046 RepID=UPI00371D0327